MSDAPGEGSNANTRLSLKCRPIPRRHLEEEEKDDEEQSRNRLRRRSTSQHPGSTRLAAQEERLDVTHCIPAIHIPSPAGQHQCTRGIILHLKHNFWPAGTALNTTTPLRIRQSFSRHRCIREPTRHLNHSFLPAGRPTINTATAGRRGSYLKLQGRPRMRARDCQTSSMEARQATALITTDTWPTSASLRRTPRTCSKSYTVRAPNVD